MERLLTAFRMGRRFGAQDWAGRCAFVLACGLSLGWAGALLMAAWQEAPVSQQGANLLSTLGGAIAGAVATYLGSTLHQTDTGSVATPPTDTAG